MKNTEAIPKFSKGYGVADKSTYGRLSPVQKTLPALKKDEVLIKISHSGVAFGDTMYAKGLYASLSDFPYIPGYDAVGQIAAVGSEVKDFKAGQRVAAFPMKGGFADYVITKAVWTAPLPDEVAESDAAALVVNYITAYQLIYKIAGMNDSSGKGHTALVHGAAGGVGLALCQMLKRLGVTVYGTASPQKHSLLKQNGVIPIDYHTEDFIQVLQKAHPEGIDVVFDGVSVDHAKKSKSVLKKSGQVVLFGITQMAKDKGDKDGTRKGKNRAPGFLGLITRVAMFVLFSRKPKAKMYGVRYSSKTDEFQQDSKKVFEWFLAGDLQPKIDSIVPLDQVGEAIEKLYSGRVFGKIVLKMDS